MTCCAAHRSPPTLFVAVVALSAVAFIGQALALPTADGASVRALHAATMPTLR